MSADALDARASPIWDFRRNASNQLVVLCKICADGIERNGALSHRTRHESSQAHKRALQRRNEAVDEAELFLRGASSVDPAQNTTISDKDIADEGLRNLLSSLGGGVSHPYPVPNTEPDYQTDLQLEGASSNSVLGISWNMIQARSDTEFVLSADDRAVASLTNAILQRFDLDAFSDDDENERSENDLDTEPHDDESPSRTQNLDPQSDGLPPPPKRPRGDHEHESEAARLYWHPWEDRITCTLDILMHLPRSVFSQRQLDLFLWLLKVNNIPYVPSIKQMQRLNLGLQKLCGIETIAYNGALGHKYFVNNIAQIIAQEMANPRVRRHLSFYPEDSGSKLSEARQGQRWLNEIPDTQTTPMARLHGHDYYIYEPCMASAAEATAQFVIPTRWFTREGSLFARCWRMIPVASDCGSGWRVIKTVSVDIPASHFFKNFLGFQADAGVYGVPHPSYIIDVVDTNAAQPSVPWTYTNAVLGNPWRAKAKGCRVVSFPMWLYCDDTSGNVSKKWNKHNSFLMTPAGLNRHESQKEFNIHFLCTSNLAPPLEMMDGVVEQLEHGQENGIWAWDIVLQEAVLVIPEVLALLGDNPMQNQDDLQPQRSAGISPATQNASDVGSDGDASSVGAQSDDSLNSTTKSQKKRAAAGKRALETMGQMVTRVKAFMTISRLRQKSETIEHLRSEFITASTTVDKKTQIKQQRTETGIKDTFQQFFVEKLFDSHKNKRGQPARLEALRIQADALPAPDKTMSPVWRIKGLDPHQDTPVEILHVVLLGFVKYLWRDLIQIQIKNKDDKKELLVTRLNSVDTHGLGISPLAGRTLVQYAGSLTGRDFRAIAQVAPFTVYDLVAPECFETWKALSKLVPLIWQPKIDDIEIYLDRLTREIDHFLSCAARWTNRWFNKPKFHILLHLPAHIRRFGPAILFATEAFESFNAIIRSKSVHSNRHAPSRDIAAGFAQGNRVRHLLSGGLFRSNPSQTSNSSQGDWISAGPGPLALVEGTVASYLGLAEDKGRKVGGVSECIDKGVLRRAAETVTAKHIAAWNNQTGLFKSWNRLELLNGDRCGLRSYVLTRRDSQTRVCRLEELLQRPGSVNSISELPDIILLQEATVDPSLGQYGMPRLVLSGRWYITCLEDILCSVNVQHNCIKYKCDTSGSVPVYQERVKTTQTQAQIHHRGDRDDVVLNTAQMRDALYLQTFRIDAPPPNLEMVVHESAAKEISLRQGSKGRTNTPALPSITAARPIPMAARPASMLLPSGARLLSHSSVPIHHPGLPHGSSSLSHSQQ
ncbi:unnamed protein product [Mycena citricolor]|uniref:Uncharacterized protein n=1 Tax=Mycena citricolor TaxID=2018698 RepID=A0AAD2K3N3_9AGAR|nr:unnamed protein product [Mycena citricolor]